MNKAISDPYRYPEDVINTQMTNHEAIIATLRAQNERLIAALKEIASVPSYTSSQQDISDAVCHIADKARAALENLRRDEG